MGRTHVVAYTVSILKMSVGEHEGNLRPTIWCESLDSFRGMWHF